MPPVVNKDVRVAAGVNGTPRANTSPEAAA